MNVTTVTTKRSTYQIAASQYYYKATDQSAWCIFYVRDGVLDTEPANIGGAYDTEAEAEAVITRHAEAMKAKLEGRPIGYRGYVEKEDAVYGKGRVFVDQLGATQYDDGSGNFSVQVWDN